MKMKLSIVVVLAAVMVSAFNCEEESDIKDEFVTEFSTVVSTALPENGKVNEEITFIVRHEGGECSQYSGNETDPDGDDVIVTFYTSHLKNQMCQKNIRIFETAYTFKPTTVGNYVFHFKRNESDLVQEILISE